MNEQRYNEKKTKENFSKQSGRDYLLALLKNLKEVAKSWGYADVVAEIERRENSLNVNTLTKQTYRSCLGFIKNTESKLNTSSLKNQLLERLDILQDSAQSLFRADLVAEIERTKIALHTKPFTKERYQASANFADTMLSKISEIANARSRGF